MERKYFITVVLSFFIFLSVLFCQRYSQSLPSRIDELVNEYVINYGFMGSVLVAEKGKVIFSKGYGLADVEQNIPNTPETKFMIGSITKQFTAMLVTQLVEKGKLRLDNTISDFVPGFPRDIGEKITVEMLLCHTSGLPFPEGIEKYYYVSTKDEYLREFLKQLSEEGLRFEPGQGYGYSNAGYFILGLMIEKVTGKTYEAVLNEQILNPLGMSNTGCDRKGLVLENGAISYQKLPNRYITWSDMYSYDPAICGFGYGSMYSTVGDLFKFSKALSTNQLLSDEYMDIYLKMRNIKKHTVFISYFITLIILIISQDSVRAQVAENASQKTNDLKAIEEAIHNVFGWAVKKDFALFFQTIADDSNFISVTPYNRLKFGFIDVRKDSAFWGSPHFKAIRHEVRDLKIRFSRSGDVAWFYCVVDDFNEWKGEPANWENVRWTGVLEKREGKWRIVQQHFSWAKENAY